MNDTNFVFVEDEVKLHITDVGQGKPVVLIHGWPESDEIFKYQYESLANRGYRAIGITMRGYGKSDRVPGTYTFDTFSLDIQKAIQKLQLTDVTLVGFSMGGAIVAHCIAYLQPAEISKLVLISANVPLVIGNEEYPEGPLIEALNGAIAYISADRVGAVDVYGKLFQLTKEYMPGTLGEWINKINLEASEEATLKGMKSLRDTDLRPVLHKIVIPTVIFHNVSDDKAPFKFIERFHTAVPNSVIVPFNEGGHWLLFTEADKLVANLVDFVG